MVIGVGDRKMEEHDDVRAWDLRLWFCCHPPVMAEMEWKMVGKRGQIAWRGRRRCGIAYRKLVTRRWRSGMTTGAWDWRPCLVVVSQPAMAKLEERTIGEGG